MGKKSGAAQRIAEPPELGNPGEFYFTEPQVVEIKSPKPVLVPTTSSYTAQTYGEGVCRLPSSHSQPNYKPPQGIEYHLSRWPNKMDVDAYLEMFRLQGFDKGAIVCRKYQTFESHKLVHRWGVILLTHNFMTAAEYKPYCVKWFGDGTVESAWGEDLFIIHAALDANILHDILEEQGCDVPKEILVKGVTLP